MCLILDANCYGKYLDDEDEDMAPIRKAFKSAARQKRGRNRKVNKMVYSYAGKLGEELKKCKEMVREIRAFEKVDIALHISSEELEEAMRGLNVNELQSDDEHILALAIASRATILVSHDGNLHKDFKKYHSTGRIYTNKDNADLLKKHRCPL